MNKLAYWRAKRGLTVRQLAAKSGVNAGGISRAEKGHLKPYLSTLGRLALALDIDVMELAELAQGEGDGADRAGPLAQGEGDGADRAGLGWDI
jgi:transcriptional regulator with XRE-family HTH domain